MLLSHELMLLGFSLAEIAAETLGQRQQKGPVLLLLLRLGRDTDSGAYSRLQNAWMRSKQCKLEWFRPATCSGTALISKWHVPVRMAARSGCFNLQSLQT